MEAHPFPEDQPTRGQEGLLLPAIERQVTPHELYLLDCVDPGSQAPDHEPDGGQAGQEGKTLGGGVADAAGTSSLPAPARGQDGVRRDECFFDFVGFLCHYSSWFWIVWYANVIYFNISVYLLISFFYFNLRFKQET